MSAQHRAIVVGAGVIGTSAALHLLRAGVSVTLLERDGVGQGTSAAGAGFVDPWSLGAPSGSGGTEEAALADYGVEFYRSLHALEPASPYRQRGLIWMAATEADWPYVEPRLTEGPPDARAVEPAEIEGLTSGFVRAAGVFRGVLRPRSAQVSAERATRALAKVFIHEGGDLRERTPVTEVIVSAGQAHGVRTPAGVLEADVVIVAAGAWTNELVAPAGGFLPFAPLLASRIVTEPLDVPHDLPLLFIRSQATGMPRSYWLREEAGRLLYGTVYRTPARYALVDGALPDRLDGIDLDGVLAFQAGARAFADAIPAVAQHRNMRIMHGAPGYTADGRPLAGALEAVPNLYVIAGCNEQGVTYGPGLGRVIAETITDGAAFVDGTAWNPNRFGTTLGSIRDVVASIDGERVPASSPA